MWLNLEVYSMSTEFTPVHDKQPRDEGNWANTSTLRVGRAPTGR
jgi:hypothetical protein